MVDSTSRERVVRLTPPSKLGQWFRSDLGILTLLAFVRVLLHTLVNGQYGFHRDELLTLDNARHLSRGYVVYPPVTPLPRPHRRRPFRKLTPRVPVLRRSFPRVGHALHGTRRPGTWWKAFRSSRRFTGGSCQRSRPGLRVFPLVHKLRLPLVDARRVFRYTPAEIQ